MDTITTTEAQNNDLKSAQSGNERNSPLTDSLTGVLKNDYDEKEMCLERRNSNKY